MSSSAFQRLQRVLELEAKQNWRNRAVIGGLGAMAVRWQNDALAEGADADRVASIVGLLVAYDQADPQRRPDMAETLGRTLAGVATDDEIETALTMGEADEADAEPTASSAVVPAPDDPQDLEELQNRAREELGSGGGDGPGSPPDSTGYDTETGDTETGDTETGDTETGDEEEAFSAPLPPAEPTHIAERKARRRRQQAANPQNLDVTVTRVNGVGRAVAELLARLDIQTVRDFLWYFPTRHEDYSVLRTVAQLEPGEQATVVANLWDVKKRKIRHNREMLIGTLADATGTMQATWYNKWVEKQLKPATTLRFSGKVGLYMGRKTFENPVFEELDEEMVATGRITPIYGLTEGLSNNRLRTLIQVALDDFGDSIVDPLPQSLRDRYELMDLATAVEQLHLPDDLETLAAARRRVAFEEMLYVQLGVAQRRALLASATSFPMVDTQAGLNRFAEGLPFALTGAQERVLEEIGRDLARSRPMTRLVQGDVGSGKTAVAAAAMYVAAANGLQSALLAPTQILAEQHFRNLVNLLERVTRPDGRPLHVELLTGRVTGAARDSVLVGLEAGEIDVVVGTTALIQENVQFAELGFVVVDEQHRFGVEQRTVLRDKGRQPHMLVMSATPIPRSLALTLYGDLDLSLIDELPPGRKEITTRVFGRRERERLYGFLRREAQAGRQAFIVYPLVEESEMLDAGAATTAYEQLRTEILPDLRIGLLHGRMTGNEKDETMRAFAAGEFDILVSTTVIEVGIDVPNASTILIEDAERFGLAQLHQLRGRVGRGEHASYCALISGAESDEARVRLNAVAELSDGFRLAEKDLELRGPGEFLGKRQSGLPGLRYAELTDVEMIAETRSAATWLLERPGGLEQDPALVQMVQTFWQGEGDVS